MNRHSYDRFERSDNHGNTDQIDQSIESPDGSPQEAGEPAPSDEFCDELSPPDSRGDDPSPAADEQSSRTDPPSADGEVASADVEVVPPEDEPWSIDEEADLEVDEAMHLHALLLLLRGLSYREIANTCGRSERTIRRWIKKARKRGLVQVDRIKPWEQLSEILLMYDQQRGELLDLKALADQNRDGPFQLRCLRELMVAEERRLNMLKKVGLFEGYTPYRSAAVRALEYGGRFGPDSRTEVDDDYDDEEDKDARIGDGEEEETGET